MRITSQTILLALSLGLGACDSADPAGDESSTGAATSTSTADSPGTTGADSEPDHGCPACEDASTSTSTSTGDAATGDESSSTSDDATTCEASTSSDVGSSSSSSSTGEPAPDPFCGDGQVDADEQCDNGAENNGPGQLCNVDCGLNVCGDGDVSPDEACDDGNQIGGDGCSQLCTRYDQPGIATDLPASELVGWQPCWASTYGTASPVSDLLAACTLPNILIACRPVGSETLTSAAHGYLANLQANDFVAENGANWAWSPAKLKVISVAPKFPSGCAAGPGLCWRVSDTQKFTGGYCGTTEITGLNSNQWERVAYHAAN